MQYFKSSTLLFNMLGALILLTGISTKVIADGSTATEIIRFDEGSRATVQLTGFAAATSAAGTVKVTNQAGESKLSVTINGLPSPQAFGEYFTCYVLWSFLPEGPTANRLLSIPLTKAKDLAVTIPSQRWGLVVTAEPYPVVTEPSSKYAMVMSMAGSKRGISSKTILPLTGKPNPFYVPASVSTLNHGHPPLPVLGARVAVEVARRAEAETYAESKYVLAVHKLDELETVWMKSPKREKTWAPIAAETNRLAHEARLTALAVAERERLAAEEVAKQQAIAESQAHAEQARLEAANARMGEEAAKRDAEQAKRDAEQAQRDAEAAKARLQTSLSAIMNTRRDARGLVVNLSDVLFDFGEDTLRPDAREGLAKIAGLLLAYPLPAQLTIEGHTDSVGSDEYNLDLSQRRANAVRDYLVESGISVSMIVSTVGVGKAHPIASNDTKEGQSRNRRVEIIIDDDLND
jgi:outer membrane protein OmpA-like peptidoglycan-associated protein